MSLNGLDNPDIVKTFTVAIQEPAGWFLIKYVSRDTVDLLGTGATGVAEARACMATYEEKSPLYGLILFRRKRVLIKYIPEGTSRLLQVRTAVHWTGVLEKYSPYDAILDITTVDGLNDTGLAATFPLHAGDPSGSTNPLGEIDEDGEEAAIETPQSESASPGPSRTSRKAALDRMASYTRSFPTTTQTTPAVRVSAENAESNGETSIPQFDGPSSTSPIIEPDAINDLEARVDKVPTGSHAEIIAQPDSKDQGVQSNELPDRTDLDADEPTLDSSQLERPRSLTSSPVLQPFAPFARSPVDSIRSDLNARPDSAVLKDMGIYDFRPKVKLGPRPVQVSERKKTAQMPGIAGRATSAVPAKILSRKQTLERTTTPASLASIESANKEHILHVDERLSTSTTLESDLTVPSANTPEDSEASARSPHQSSSRPPSGASTWSRRNSQPKSPLTPEKQRLIKAVEMRRRKLRFSQQISPTQVSTTSPPSGTTCTRSMSSNATEEEGAELPNRVLHATGASTSAPNSKNSDSGVALAARETQPEQLVEPTIDHEAHMSDDGFAIAPPMTHSPQVDEAGDDSSVPPETVTGDDHRPVDDLVEDGHLDIGTSNGAEETAQGDAVPSSPIMPATLNPFRGSTAEVPVTPEQSREAVADTSQDGDTPPAEPTTDATFFSESSTRDVSLAPTDEMGQTALYEESISTKGEAKDQDAFFETASEKSIRNTWLSDASELVDRAESPTSVARSERQTGRGFAVPRAITTPHTQSETNGSVDGSDFEYFSTATVHEATSVAVLRPPTTPVLAKQPSVLSMTSSPTPRPTTPVNDGLDLQRAKTTSPMPTSVPSSQDAKRLTPGRQRVTTTSSSPGGAAELVSTSKKGLIGSGISQRIAKLEQTSREPSPLPSPSGLSTPPTNTGMSKKHIFTGRVTSTATTDPELLKSRLRSLKSLPGNRDSPKQPEPRLDTNAYYTVHTDPNTRRQSVSVTAKIVRPNTQSHHAPAILAAPSITLDSSEARPSDSSALPPTPRSHSVSSTRSRRSADSSVLKRFSFNNRAKSSDSRLERLSGTLTSGLQSRNQEGRARDNSPLRHDSGGLPPSNSKRDRTSRFLKRMSTFSSTASSRNKHSSDPASAVSEPQSVPPATQYADKPLPLEPHFSLPGFEPALLSPPATADADSPPPAPIRLGGVNVQFPGSGLWKHRFIEIDGRGQLLFSPNDKSSYGGGSSRHAGVPLSRYNTADRGGAGIKSWRLSEVERVFVPRLDDMELAHSVVLELKAERGEVVLACGDARGQREILDVLLNYHQAWNAVGQE